MKFNNTRKSSTSNRNMYRIRKNELFISKEIVKLNTKI